MDNNSCMNPYGLRDGEVSSGVSTDILGSNCNFDRCLFIDHVIS